MPSTSLSVDITLARAHRHQQQQQQRQQQVSPTRAAEVLILWMLSMPLFAKAVVAVPGAEQGCTMLFLRANTMTRVGTRKEEEEQELPMLPREGQKDGMP